MADDIVGAEAPAVPGLPARAEATTLDALRHRLAFEDLLTQVASTFLHRPAFEVSRSIADVLALIAGFAQVDRAFVYRVDTDRARIELTHEWLARHEVSRAGERLVDATVVERWLRALAEDGAVYVPCVATMDESWHLEHAWLERSGTSATLAVPIADGGRTIGFIGFDLLAGERLWSDDHLAVLASTAGIISQALGRSDAEQRFGMAFDRAPLGMALHNSEGRHVQVNPAFCELLGRPATQLLEMSVLDVIVESDRPLLLAEHRRILAGEVDQLTLEIRFARPDGVVVWCRVHSAAVRDGDDLRYTVSHVEDITERVSRDAALRASEERFRTLVENSPVLIVRIDRDLQIVYMSESVTQVTGLSVEELSAAPGQLFRNPDDIDRWAREVQAVFDTGARRDTEWEIPFGDDSFWFQSRAVPEFGADGEVEHVLVVNADITAIKRSEAALAHQALHDPLTGLANRALLLDVLGRSLATRRDAGPAVLFIDLDRFKLINDSLGHRAGDELLVAVAHRLSAVARPSDLIARLGGDEFVLVLDDVADPSEPVRVANRIREALAEPILIGSTEVVTTGSIGIAMALGPAADADGLLRDADAAMYLAKANGRNRCEIFDKALRTQATQKLQMETALRRALEIGGLEVHYQPELDLETGVIVGVEALVRWNHPTEGPLAAWAFIELAEETGIILDLGAWVLTEACRQAGRWRIERPDQPLTLRVNLSGKQFAQADLVQQVVAAMEAGNIEPSSLCLEITETALMADPAMGLRVLNDLRALGIELAIDDFGTGYSSLAYLKRFPVDVLKIDRSFVDGLGDDPDDTAIATAIISLARSMGMRVVAEGVETQRQLDELRRLGCDHAQGFLFARPAHPDTVWLTPNPYPLGDPAPTG